MRLLRAPRPADAGGHRRGASFRIPLRRRSPPWWCSNSSPRDAWHRTTRSNTGCPAWCRDTGTTGRGSPCGTCFSRPAASSTTSRHWAYSDTNYLLAGMIARKASGENWRHLVEHRVIAPLGLRAAHRGLRRGDHPGRSQHLLPGPGHRETAASGAVGADAADRAVRRSGGAARREAGRLRTRPAGGAAELRRRLRRARGRPHPSPFLGCGRGGREQRVTGLPEPALLASRPGERGGAYWGLPVNCVSFSWS